MRQPSAPRRRCRAPSTAQRAPPVWRRPASLPRRRPIKPPPMSQPRGPPRSPLAGVVTRMNAVLGSSVDASQTLVEVADPAALDIVFNVSPAEAGRIRAGDTLVLSGRDAAGGESLGTATVLSVGAALDSVSRAVAVRARTTRATSRALRIGESVFGRIVTAVHADAITVPVEALVPEGDEFQVFVVD